MPHRKPDVGRPPKAVLRRPTARASGASAGSSRSTVPRTSADLCQHARPARPGACRLCDRRYVDMLERAKTVSDTWNFASGTVKLALEVLHSCNKIEVENAEDWAARSALRISAIFRHFSQSVCKKRKWVPKKFFLAGRARREEPFVRPPRPAPLMLLNPPPKHRLFT